MRPKGLIVLHPFLFALHPVLSLYSLNIGAVHFVGILRAAGVALAAALIAFAVLRLALRDAPKAGVVVTLAVLMFFLYGPFRPSSRCTWGSYRAGRCPQCGPRSSCLRHSCSRGHASLCEVLRFT